MLSRHCRGGDGPPCDLRACSSGAGAAGGLGLGPGDVLRARGSCRGFDVVAKLTGLADKLRGAALCVTGEGRIDAQSLAGKVVAGVAALDGAAPMWM